MELQGRIDDLTRQGLGVAVISYDPPEILAAFARAQRISFPLLSDSDSATIRRYGILNPLPELALAGGADDPALKAELQRYVSPGTPASRMAGMAFPGTFVVDRQGRVTSRFFEESYVERNTIASVMLKLGNGWRAGQRSEALDAAPRRHGVSERWGSGGGQPVHDRAGRDAEARHPRVCARRRRRIV